MKAIITAIQEIYGLFVDDGSYALSIIVCLLVAGFVFTRVHVSGGIDWRGPVLFVALCAVMLASVMAAARKNKP